MLAGVAIVYVLAGLVGLLFAFVNPAASPIWPAAGVAVAALLVVGPRAWPVFAVAAFFLNLYANQHAGAAAIIAVGNTLEYVLAAVLARRVARGRHAFESGSGVFRFMFVAALAAPLVAATFGAAALRLAGLAPAADVWRIWLTWWLGDATGIALYAPFCVLLASPPLPARAGRGELAALVGGLCLVLVAAFGVPADLQRDIPVAILVLPLMLWSAFRVDARTTAALGIMMSVIGTYRILNHYGPFELGAPASALLMVQSLVAIISLLMLAVAAESGVRRLVEHDMRVLNETLERRVDDRTAELTRMRNRLVEAQEVAQIGSWEWDVADNTLWWSEELCRIFGVATPPGYEPYLQLLHPDDRARTDEAVRHSMRTGEPFVFEHRILRPDGEQRVLHAKGRVEFDANGAPRRMVGIGHDITERLRAEEARVQLMEEHARLRDAEEANRAKDAFLATLSHELRTPLNAALGWAHILRESIRAEGRDERVVQAIWRNLQLQSRIVSDILDISRIAKGELPLEREPVEMRAVFDAAVEMVRETASARGVTIEVRGAGAPTVLGDGRRLQQVGWNLLSNAVKFCAEHGHVTVSIVESGDRVECSVEDDGPGIAPAFLPHVFDRFRQADSSTTREHGGLGLGLAIAREIVAMHDGTIVAGNRAGGGAVFVVTLPKMSAAGGMAVSVALEDAYGRVSAHTPSTDFPKR